MRAKNKTLMKNFKVSPEEWEQFKKLQVDRYRKRGFGAVCRTALKLLVSMSEPEGQNGETLFVNPAVLRKSLCLLDEFKNEAKANRTIDAEAANATTGQATPTPLVKAKQAARWKKLPGKTSKARPSTRSNGSAKRPPRKG